MIMPRTTATFSISVPPEMADELERVRKVEHRTRSELVREALRQYIRAASVRSVKERIAMLPEAEATGDEVDAIEAGRREFRTKRPIAISHALGRQPQRSRSKKS